MMQVIINPPKSEWLMLVQRPLMDNTELFATVSRIINSVKSNGDAAIRNYSYEFDGAIIEKLQVSSAEIDKASALVPEEIKIAIQQAAANITRFHEQQISPFLQMETMPGVRCWQRSVAIEKVGLYIPGGSAPLFSTLLMLGIPAKIAGCKEIIVCTPADKNNEVNASILYTASLLGISSIFKVGGAQAIAAMALGTQSIPQVYKIFGPGNQYVTAAKQLIQLNGVAIDMPAGPSEVCVLAEDSSNAEYIAADLLSQAEHGKDSQVMLITTSENLINDVIQSVYQQLKQLPRAEIILQCLEKSKAILVKDIDDGIELVNEYAPEHLIICTTNEDDVASRIINAGSVFIGNYSPEAAGDYATGTNHTLPTNGFAKAYSGVCVDSFMKKITYQKLSTEGLKNISQTVITMANAEGLSAHANAIKIRTNV